MVAQHALHHKISAHKYMAAHSCSRTAKERSHRNTFIHFRHMACLAATVLCRITAVQPFLVRHLFGKSAELFASGAASCGDQRMATAAQRRIAYLRSLH